MSEKVRAKKKTVGRPKSGEPTVQFNARIRESTATAFARFLASFEYSVKKGEVVDDALTLLMRTKGFHSAESGGGDQ